MQIGEKEYSRQRERSKDPEEGWAWSTPASHEQEKQELKAEIGLTHPEHME